jgi:hypothetical protein
VFLFLTGVLFYGYIAYQPQEEVIVWSESQRLTWNDFRGKPEPRNSIASTHYSLKKKLTDHGNSATVKVIAVFYPNDSWKRKKKKGVLAHEQRHFDIVELFARKLRKQIQSGIYENYDDLVAKVNRYYDETDRELDAYQDRYDRMTSHSRNSRRQAKWNSKVEMELDELSNYKVNTFEVFYEATSSR